MSETIHATCVAIDGCGVLLLGAPGSGKSDLALRLIDRGAELVADDSTIIEERDGRLYARCPQTIAGKLEVRGVGILELPARDGVPLVLAIAVDGNPERLPDAHHLPVRHFGGLDLPVLAMPPFDASAPLKVEKALALYGRAHESS
ncbi:HPr kinase/phosphorylase [Sphingomonas nostoxanthinifaciens]|uniref:HPr kinase/phosphorylase n=1 Tax=Sphingomonas nostoxanthinifaciens TaxID=2872652 RepID=UPI001CC1DE31|nr:HPr kinase/phosphatase C-terminal domain-containing protein [Sphingomonas nostoxanthinifaciens]UAK26020.1 HPr kinase/phosphatase C-terminal domain-containing protein [Sphingomonas nostoxanthinifaciens]